MALKTLNRLTVGQINKAIDDRPLGGHRLHADGGGLYLQITARGSSWVVQYKKAGKLREMGLGTYPDVGLTKARSKAGEVREARRAYDDPIEIRRAKMLAEREAKATVTFTWCAERYIAANAVGWRSARHREQWGQSLATYVYPVFGELSVAAIDTGLVLQVVEPLWAEKPETASRVRGRIELVLDWATGRGHRAGENPARWRGHLQSQLPKRSKVAVVKHFDAVGVDEIAGLMARLREVESVAARALEFTILCAVRRNEVLQAQWSEIDLPGRVWTVPAAHTKGGKVDRRIPLSEAAVVVLRRLDNLRGYSEFVFPGARQRGMSAPAMLLLLNQVRPGATVHGMRSTFRDWASERTRHEPAVVEIALSHAVGDAVTRAYARSDLFEKRRELMEEWGRFATGG